MLCEGSILTIFRAGKPYVSLTSLFEHCRDARRLQVDPMRKPSIGDVEIYLTLLIPEPENVMATWDIGTST